MADGTLKVGTITTSSGSGTITLGQSGETVDMANGSITLNSDMKSAPAFEAYMNASQTISDNTETAVEFDTENFDTDGAFDTGTYRFTPQTAGKYFVYTMVNVSGDANSNLEYGWCFIRKNGSKLLESRFDYRSNNGRNASPSVSQVIDLNGSTDYVDVYAAANDTTGSPIIEGTQRFTVFGAYRIIGA